MSLSIKLFLGIHVNLSFDISDLDQEFENSVINKVNTKIIQFYRAHRYDLFRDDSLLTQCYYLLKIKFFVFVNKTTYPFTVNQNTRQPHDR